jgi:hypothetical protein
MSEAALTLGAVLLGALLSIGTTYIFERGRSRTARRSSARLLKRQLAEASGAIESVLFVKIWLDDRLDVQIGTEVTTPLAAVLSDEVWKTVDEGLMAAKNAEWLRQQALAPNTLTTSVTRSDLDDLAAFKGDIDTAIEALDAYAKSPPAKSLPSMMANKP